MTVLPTAVGTPRAMPGPWHLGTRPARDQLFPVLPLRDRLPRWPRGTWRLMHSPHVCSCGQDRAPSGNKPAPCSGAVRPAVSRAACASKGPGTIDSRHNLLILSTVLRETSPLTLDGQGTRAKHGPLCRRVGTRGGLIGFWAVWLQTSHPCHLQRGAPGRRRWAEATGLQIQFCPV